MPQPVLHLSRLRRDWTSSGRPRFRGVWLGEATGDNRVSNGSSDRFDRVRTEGSIKRDVPPGLPWLREAARLYDTKDRESALRSGHLVRFAQRVAETTQLNLPWCGLFVGHCIRQALPDQRRPWIYFRARPWRRFGDDARPQLGAILLFWLRWPKSPFGHVGFYWGEDDETYHVLGGNQHASILIERFPKHRLIDCRWPAGVPQPMLRRRRPAERAAPFEYAKTG